MASRPRLRSFSLVMALAVVLNLTAPDHWGEIPNPLDSLVNGKHTHPFEEGTGHEDEAEHARHCHGDAATCSDVPLASAGGFIALAAVLAFGGVLAFSRAAGCEAGPGHGWAAAPLLPPPRMPLALPS